MENKQMTETHTKAVNGFPVNVLSDNAKLALDNVVQGIEARKIAAQALIRDTDNLRRHGWQTVGPMAFGLIKQARAEGITIPLDTMIRLRKRWQTATDDELHPIIRDVKTGLAQWLPVNINAIIACTGGPAVPDDDNP